MNNKYQTQRIPPLEGGINFRDIGGYPSLNGQQVRWNKLFRSGHLRKLSPDDINTLDSLNVTQVHDFRRKEEQKQNPSQPIRAEIINDYELFVGSMSRFWEYLTSGNLSAESAHTLVKESYGECIDDVAPAFGRLFQSLLRNANNASLFHCTAGKDRTGIAAALLLAALGVDLEVIVEDYLLTQEHFDNEDLLNVVEHHLRSANIKHWERSWLIPYVSVHEDNIRHFFASVESSYGSVNAYFQNAMNINSKQIEALKAAFLE